MLYARAHRDYIALEHRTTDAPERTIADVVWKLRCIRHYIDTLDRQTSQTIRNMLRDLRRRPP